MLKLFLFLIWLNSFSHSYIISYSSTKVITINDSDSYFGYSILLQRGNPPLAIVGAPKRKHNNKITGSVYKCDLNTLSCSEYVNLLREGGIYNNNKNGDFLGSVLDGDDVVGSKLFTCAPRFITRSSYNDFYYTNGRCFYVRNSSNPYDNAGLILPFSSINQITFDKKSGTYYDAAFGESGLDMKYLKDQNQLLIGAPGRLLWNGDVFVTKIIVNNRFQNEPFSIQTDITNYQNTYYGYAVSWGNFIKNSKTIWYVTGVPRSNRLKGNVILFERNNKRNIIKRELFGEELGSYFGASLLVIHNKDGGDDVLVGAPTYSGNSWDEGCVYYYKNKNDGTFYSPVKLSGKSSKSRFGTVIADMGDIDLDSFPDCAISAPYEDDGVGAVYLYYGTSKGFSDDNYHRISPSNFVKVYSRRDIRGFGMGISKGNDLDGNKHNDIAIGAYQSGHTFYFKTKSVVDVKGNITSSMKTLYTTTTQFSISYCLIYTLRNKLSSTDSFVIQVLLLDERVTNNKTITETVTISSNKLNCKTHTVFLKKDYPKIEPLGILYKYKSVSGSFKEYNLKIPVSSGCGADDICQTDLSIKTKVGNVANLVVGLTNELEINVTINNSGEPAYQTKLYLTVPPEISLINLRECNFENGSYVCMIAPILRKSAEKHFLLDTTNLQPTSKSLTVDFRVESTGKNINAANTKLRINIPVLLQNSPYIDSQSNPTAAGVTETKKTIELNHGFLVGNQGPSPVDLKVIILVPQLNGSRILEIKSVGRIRNGVTNKCVYSDLNLVDLNNVNVEPPLNNNSVVLSCFEPEVNCTQILCEGGYFSKSSDYVIFSLQLLVHTDLLALFFPNKDSLFIASTAYLHNGTNEILTTSYTQIYGLSMTTRLSLWIYIVSAVSGIVLLLIMIFGLYKCNFFKRTYREKLEKEFLDNGNNENEMDNIELN